MILSHQGKTLWCKDHLCFCLKDEIILDYFNGRLYTPRELVPNPTKLPNDLFEQMMPVLLVRHPAFTVPSFYEQVVKVSEMRPGDEDFVWATTLQWSVYMHDFFKHQGRAVIVIDGDDMCWRSESSSQYMYMLGP